MDAGGEVISLRHRPPVPLAQCPTIAPLSIVDGRRRLHRDMVEQLSARWPGVLRTSIPAAADVERMTVMRAPLAVYAPRCPAMTAFDALWTELARRAGARHGAATAWHQEWRAAA